MGGVMRTECRSARVALSVGAAVFAAFSAVGVGDAGAANLKGSEILGGVTRDIITSCGLGAALTYVGGGSNPAQVAMVSLAQQVAPMARELNATACDATKGAQALLIGLDGIAIAGANQVAGDSFEASPATDDCRDSIQGGKSVAVADCSVVGTACDQQKVTGTGTYTFASWRDVLAMVYGGQNHSAAPQLNADKTRNPARINCLGPVRQTLVNAWGTIFSDTGAPRTCRTGTCARLKHAFRLGDQSDTTDTFVRLVGLVPIPPYTTTSSPNPFAFPTKDGFATVNPFCNAGSATMNKGDSDYLDLDPIRRIADSGAVDATANRRGLEQVAEGYLTVANPPAVPGNDTRLDPTPVELSDYGASNRQNIGPDPNNSAWLSAQQAALAQRKGLGLVLPIEIPSNFGDEGVAYWSPSSAPGQAPVACDPGVFSPSLPDARRRGFARTANRRRAYFRFTWTQ